MAEKIQPFKFNVGDKVSGHKHGFGKVYGIITGRTYLSQGTPLYWIKDDNGATFKLPQHQVRGQ